MRIISGRHKGRKIIAPKKLPIRPTTDMAKESLFNILRNSYTLLSLSVLDLFAGSGNISYEFASRGSESITAVDSDAGCVSFINKTAQDLEMPIEAFKSDVFKFLERSGGSYDVIFGDPPYNWEASEFLKIVDLVFQKNLLNSAGTLVLEHSKHTDLSTGQNYQESRKYGGSSFSFFSKQE
ncbi:MAG: RsmD family RNA methyltransferase [Leeuwenhoekiella sp.]